MLVQGWKAVGAAAVGLALLLGPSGAARAGHTPDEKAKRLELQHHLDYDAPFADATFFGTHNSFNSGAYKDILGFPIYIAPNHEQTMKTQLDKGARVLNLDIHPFHISGAFNVILCHSALDGATGCLGSDLDLAVGLAEIRTWLLAHPTEVVLIILEDKLTSDTQRGTATTDIENQLDSLVYTPADHAAAGGDTDEGCNDIPMKGLTKQAILDEDRQVILATNEGCDNDSLTFRDYVWNVPFHPVKTLDRTTAPFFERRLMRYPHLWSFLFEDRVFNSVPKLTSTNLVDGVRRGAGAIGVDELIKDDRRASVIWSWQTNKPDDGDNVGPDCAVSTSAGWNDVSCFENHSFACQSTLDGSWKVTDDSSVGKWEGGDAACQALGAEYIFSVPINATLNAALRTVAGTEAVWINYTDGLDSEGDWLVVDFVPRQVQLFEDKGTFAQAASEFDVNIPFHLWKIPTDRTHDTLQLLVVGGGGGDATIKESLTSFRP